MIQYVASQIRTGAACNAGGQALRSDNCFAKILSSTHVLTGSTDWVVEE